MRRRLRTLPLYIISVLTLFLCAGVYAEVSAGTYLCAWGGRGHVSDWTGGLLATRYQEAIHLTLNDRFAEADSLLTRLDSALFDDGVISALCPLLAAGAVHAQMIDEESTAHYDRYVAWRDRAESRAAQLEQIDTGYAEVAFVRGAIAGYDAVYEARWGGWFGALRRGMAAKKWFERALEADGELVDVLLGIGNYNFWKAVNTDFINWLPLIPDNRRKGLEQLARAASAGTFVRETARSSLIWALIHEERYGDALAHTDTLSLLVPEGKAPLWMKARATYELEHWNEAHDLYDEIERRIMTAGPGNYFNLIECAYYRARCDEEAGRWQEAIAECQRVSEFPLPEETQKRQKKKLAELRRLKRELAEKLGATAENEAGR